MKKKPFEMSKKDKEPKGMKEGSLMEEMFDRKQMKKGSCTKKMATGGKVRGIGCAIRGINFSRNG